MQKIEQGKVSELIYKPVISKVVWIGIGVVFAAILLTVVFVSPNTGSAPVVMQKLTGIFSFQFPDLNFIRFSDRLLQLLSGFLVLFSVLAVGVVIGWHYLFMQSRNSEKRNRFSGMLFY